MSAIQFPTGPANGDTHVADNGVLYKWVAAGDSGYWSSDTTDSGFDDVYLRLNAANGPVTGNLGIGSENQILLNADGSAAFELLTTHESGVSVTGGDNTTVNTGVYSSTGSDLRITANGNFVGIFNSSGIGLGASVDSNSNVVISQANFTDQNKSNGLLINKSGSGNGTDMVGASIVLNPEDNTTANVTGIQVRPPVATQGRTIGGEVYGFAATDQLSYFAGTSSQNTFGFYGGVVAGGGDRNNYNFYAAGNAPNYFNGNIIIGDTTSDASGTSLPTFRFVNSLATSQGNQYGRIDFKGNNQVTCYIAGRRFNSDSAGEVVIATASAGNSATIIGRFGSGGTDGNLVTFGNQSNDRGNLRLNLQDNNTDAYLYVKGVYYNTNTSTNQTLRIDTQGEIQRISSSRRYKNNIQPISSVGGLSVINQLAPKQWKDLKSGETTTGFVAEEVAAAGADLAVCYAPYDSTSVTNGETPVTKDGVALAEGVDIIEEVTDRGLIAHLVKAVQELSAKVEALENA